MHPDNETQDTIYSDRFSEALHGFLVGAQAKIDSYFARNFPRQYTNLELTDGPKYVRIVSNYMGQNRSVFCFIDKETGRVWKAKSWRTPERKNPRSCIYDADNGLSGVDHHGAVYLR